MNSTTQCKAIADHLKKPGARLTSLDALPDMGGIAPPRIRPTAMHRVRNWVGTKLGTMVVASYSHHDGQLHRWNVECECGIKKTLTSSVISAGKQQSCGCLTRAIQVKAHSSHGQSSGHGRRGSQAYRCWKSMWDRCTQSSRHDWMSYGGRGISICDQWKSFEQFFADMSPAEEGLSLDRIDGNGNYEPANCRWATPKEQANNRRSNKVITFNGITRTVTQWAEEIGVKPSTLIKRLETGMDLNRAMMSGDMRSARLIRSKSRVAEYSLAVKS